MQRHTLFVLLVGFQLLQLCFQSKASQSLDPLGESVFKTQNLTAQGYAKSSETGNVRSLLEQSRQNYNAGEFMEAERLAREALEQLQREYGAQPNFRIPSPGGVRETRFSIPLIFEFYRSYTAPSEVTRLVASERVPFDTLFNEMVARISGDPSGLEIADLPTQLHNRFGGCLYFGSSGYSCTNTSSFSRFEDLLGDNPELREQFPGLFQTQEERQEFIGQYSGDVNNDLHSVLKDSLSLIQKSLVAQEEEKGIEALVFAEMSRNTEFVRLAPLVLYGLLNYDAIASNPSYSRFFGSVGLSNLDLNSIRGIASRENATIIYYSILASEPNEDLLVWVVQPSGNITFKKVGLSNSEVPLNSLISQGYTAAASFIDRGQQETALIQAVRSLRSQGYERERASASDFLVDESTQTSRLQALYNVLIKPVEELLPTDPEEQVIFVPHKSLTAVPFAALQDSEGRYVIEKHTIRMAHSLSNLKNPIEPIEEMPNADEFLAVGNPDSRDLNLTYSDGSRLNLSNLPAADSEVEDISSDGYWFRRDAATWRRVSPWIEDAKIIHLATHGILNFDNRKEFMLVQLLEEGKNKSFYIEQDKRNISSSSDFEYRLWYDQVNPDKSWQVAQASLNLPGAIILADLALTAEQILSLQLSADLVVLSACNSGRGVPTESGILGLPFALGLAGVPRVVVSQWSVPDASTRLLMISYYNAMRENIRLYGEANPPAALRKAMLEIKDFEYYQDPIYWAGFTTIDVAY